MSAPGFRWLFIAAVAIGFASVPFYAVSAPFLIRTHGLTAGEVGLSFGLLQGGLGVIDALLGGRGRPVRTRPHHRTAGLAPVDLGGHHGGGAEAAWAVAVACNFVELGKLPSTAVNVTALVREMPELTSAVLCVIDPTDAQAVVRSTRV